MKEHTPQSQNEALKKLLEDPNGAYQRWRRQEAPYHEMCRAVVLAYVGASDSTLNAERSTLNPVFLRLAS